MVLRFTLEVILIVRVLCVYCPCIVREQCVIGNRLEVRGERLKVKGVGVKFYAKIRINSQISKFLEDFFVKKYHSFTSVRYPATGMFEKDRQTDRQNFFNLRPRAYGDEKENSSVFLSFWLKISTNSCTYQKKTVPLRHSCISLEQKPKPTLN